MTAKWMLGTALAAVMAAGAPALAQTDMSEFGECALNEMTNEEFLGLDLDNDSGLTQEEYRECLTENDIDLSDEQMQSYDAAYTEADVDADGLLIYAEIEEMQGSAQQADAAPQGTITVTQPAADVTVDQPAPDVTVQQPEPTVQVETQQPQVDVTTPEPQVAVQQAEPTVQVEQPEPTVAVEQPEPTVQVEQPEPQVDVTAGQPAVEVETQQPEVAVQTPTPEVDVQQPELDVQVEQEQPQVAVEQASPDVAVQRTTEATAETETETEVAVAETQQVEVETAATGAYQINMGELSGVEVFNSAGEEIGEIDTVLLDRQQNTPVVILSVGGVLGIGDREIAFPYDDFEITSEQVVLNTPMSADEIEDMEEYNEADYDELPETMIVQ